MLTATEITSLFICFICYVGLKINNALFCHNLLGTVMLEHVLKCCEKDGNIDNVYL